MLEVELPPSFIENFKTDRFFGPIINGLSSTFPENATQKGPRLPTIEAI